MATPEPPVTTDRDADLVDFDVLRRRVGMVLVPVVGLSLLGVIIDGAVSGLTFELMGRWAGIAFVLSLLAVAVVTALHALGGAGRAGRRGDRLASPDVGLAPRKLAGSLSINALQQPDEGSQEPYPASEQPAATQPASEQPASPPADGATAEPE